MRGRSDERLSCISFSTQYLRLRHLIHSLFYFFMRHFSKVFVPLFLMIFWRHHAGVISLGTNSIIISRALPLVRIDRRSSVGGPRFHRLTFLGNFILFTISNPGYHLL
jgi:hypothetical protein